MHALVMAIVGLVSISTWAKRPPDLSVQVNDLNRVVQVVGEIDQRFKNINDDIQRTMEIVCDSRSFGDAIKKCEYNTDLQNLTIHQSCVSTNMSRTKRVATCVLALEENKRQLKKWEQLASSMLKTIEQIPPEFGQTKNVIKEHLKPNVDWAREIQVKLANQADRYFSINKKIIEKEFEIQMSDLKNQARTNAICSSFDRNLQLYRRFAEYYETVKTDLPTYDQLRHQVAREVWRMEFLKEKCNSTSTLAATKRLVVSLNQKVNGESFNAFKSEVCREVGESELTRSDCLELPQTAESLAVLGSIKNQNRKTK